MRDDYEVGYGKPPRHSQFVKGESGNKGRKKKRSETHSEIIARVRDETVELNGRTMTKFEVAVLSVVNNTVKSGKARDLKALFELLDKYGALPKAEQSQTTKKDAEAVMHKIDLIMERTLNIDPRQRTIMDDIEDDEARMVLKCSCCGPTLRRQWHEPRRKALAEDQLTTHLQNKAEKFRRDG